MCLEGRGGGGGRGCTRERKLSCLFILDGFIISVFCSNTPTTTISGNIRLEVCRLQLAIRNKYDVINWFDLLIVR